MTYLFKRNASHLNVALKQLSEGKKEITLVNKQIITIKAGSGHANYYNPIRFARRQSCEKIKQADVMLALQNRRGSRVA